MVTGNVKIINMGFTRKFSRLKASATQIAVVKVFTLTPGRTYDKINTAAALNKIRRIKFI